MTLGTKLGRQNHGRSGHSAILTVWQHWCISKFCQHKSLLYLPIHFCMFLESYIIRTCDLIFWQLFVLIYGRQSCWRVKANNGKGWGAAATEEPEEVPTWGGPMAVAESYGHLSHQGKFPGPPLSNPCRVLRFLSATSTPPSSGTPLPPQPQIFSLQNSSRLVVHFFPGGFWLR
jgi:hypothetical protein